MDSLKIRMTSSQIEMDFPKVLRMVYTILYLNIARSQRVKRTIPIVDEHENADYMKYTTA